MIYTTKRLHILQLSQFKEKSKECQLDYNAERPHKSLGYYSPIENAHQYYKRSGYELQPYTKTENEDYLQIDESGLVDKVFEKQDKTLT